MMRARTGQVRAVGLQIGLEGGRMFLVAWTEVLEEGKGGMSSGAEVEILPYGIDLCNGNTLTGTAGAGETAQVARAREVDLHGIVKSTGGDTDQELHQETNTSLAKMIPWTRTQKIPS